MNQTTIGQNIAFWRRKAGLTQEQLSEKLGVTAQAVSKWENDLSQPDLNFVRQMATMFGITLEELLNGESAVPVVRVADAEQREKRIVQIQVKTPETSVALRIPATLFRSMYESGQLQGLVENEEEAVAGLCAVMEMIEQGTVGRLVDVETEGTTVCIEVVAYEG